MNWKIARRIRRIVQVVCFALFIYFLFATLQQRAAPALVDIFSRLNPLSAISSMLASRAWIPRLGLALITLGLTVLIGRVWCGWICPMGSLLEWVRFRRAGKRSAALSPRLRLIKYLLLLAILFAALFGNLTLLIFDPLALLTHSMTTTLIPALTAGVNTIEQTLYPIGFMRPVIDGIERALRGTLLPVHQPVYAQNILIGLIFLVVLMLNLLADRFWCRYLCPLGGLLGLLSKIAILRPLIGDGCTRCGACGRACRPGAIERQGEAYEIVPSECTVCLDCLAGCPNKSIRFRAGLKPDVARPFDPSRRQALGALAGAAAGVLLLQTDLRSRQKNPALIRPPGAQDEDTFLSTCLRCTQCMKICPMTALQPALGQAGIEGFWTPVLTPRVGYCDYGCNACGRVCPSGAIPLLALEEKRQRVIGKAVVNRNRCLPWASNQPCIVCEEMCPTPTKSIRLEEVTVVNAQGETITVQRPYVVRELCIGCGICENRCPLEGEAAIRVYGV